MLYDARVASLEFFMDNVCTTRITKEKKFKIKFQVLKFAQIVGLLAIICQYEIWAGDSLFKQWLITDTYNA